MLLFSIESGRKDCGCLWQDVVMNRKRGTGGEAEETGCVD